MIIFINSLMEMYLKTIKSFITIVVFLCFPLNSLSQYWLFGAGGLAEDEALSVTKDNDNNIYTTGYFSSVANFSGNYFFSDGASDFFLMKSSPDGAIRWVVKGGGWGDDRGVSVKTDNFGNVYVTGTFYGTATFGSLSITSAGAQDIFIAKYDSSGTILWLKSAGGTNSDVSNSITTDVNGNITLTGQFIGTALFDTASLTSLINPYTGFFVTNVFIAHYNTNGNLIWIKHGKSIKDCRGINITCDNDCNIFTTGEYSDTITFNSVYNNTINSAIYVMKLDSSGNEKWFRKIGGSISNSVRDIVIDNNLDVLITGNALGTLYFFGSPNFVLSDTYTYKAFVAKYSNTGIFKWAVSNSSESELTSQALAVNLSNEIYFTGEFRCRFSEYADIYGQGTFNSVGYRDVFLTKIDADGQYLWSKNFGGKDDDFIRGITLINDNPVLAGGFRRILIFPSSGSTYSNKPPVSLFSANSTITYCNDTYYGEFTGIESFGYSDIFVAKAIDLTRQPYDYYKRDGALCTRPFVGCCFNNTGSDAFCKDSIINCGGTHIFAATNTSSYYNSPYTTGPDFNFLWSDGFTGNQQYCNMSGQYSVTVTSVDGCFQSSETINVIINPLPVKPWISDNFGIGTNSPVPYNIVLCSDSVLLSANNIFTTEYYWSGCSFSGLHFNDSVTVYGSGECIFTVVDSNKCINTNFVNVLLQDTLEPVIPYLSVFDTISVCKGYSVNIKVYDTITDPLHMQFCNPVFTSFNPPVWTVTPFVPGSSDPCDENGFIHTSFVFTPQDTGDYLITYMLIRQNACNVDTIYASKTYHVLVLPVPDVTATISGPRWICPGDTIELTACCGSQYIWMADTYFVGDYHNDSIQTFLPGVFSVTVTETNSYGCSTARKDTHVVAFWGVPQIQMSPSTGLICPDSAVMLSVESGHSSYEWYGPTGMFSGNLDTVHVSSSGYYYCIVTMPDGCRKTSNIAEIVQYTTPFMFNIPDNVICPDDSVVLNIVTNPGSVITWQPPLSGNAPYQVVYSQGYYSCQVSSCGIITIVGTNVFESYPVSEITVSGPTTFCSGDSVTLLANSGMISYLWYPAGTEDTVLTVYNSGNYYLTTFDSLGCTAVSDIVTVDVISPQNPSPGNIVVCSGQPASLHANLTTGIYWYDSPSAIVPVYIGENLVTTPLTNDTIFWVQQEISGCKSDLITVYVTVVPNPVITIIPDTSICYSGGVTLFVTGGTSVQWYPSTWLNNPDVYNPQCFPLSSTSYYVTVTDNNGCINTDSVTVTVNPLPVVDAGQYLLICTGSSITLSGSGASTYSWDNGITNGMPFTPLTSATYTVTGTDVNGCTDTDTVNVDVVEELFVNPGNDKTVCVSDTVILIASGAITYAWDNGINNGIPFVPLMTTTYTVTGIASDGCWDTAQVTVTVNPLPMVYAGSDTAVCSGSSVTLSGTGAESYIWNNGITNGIPFVPLSSSNYIVIGTDTNGCSKTDTVVVTVNQVNVDAGNNTSVCTGASVTLSASGAVTYFWNNGVANGVPFTPLSTLTYTVTGTDTNGCSGKDSVTVIVNQLPLVDAGPDTTVCSGTLFTLSGIGAQSYVWSNGVINGVPFAPFSELTYTVTGTDVNGCVNTDSVTVAVNPLPPVYAGADTALCAGGSVILSGSGAVSYSWNNGITNGIPFIPLSTFNYIVTGTGINGCINKDTVTITVNSLPPVFAGADTVLCAGDSITLAGSGAESYLWDNGIADGLAFIPLLTSAYAVTGTDINGCVNTDSVTVTVNLLPAVYAGADTVLCAGDSITLSGSGAESYIWSNGITDGEYFVPLSTLNYIVTGADITGCINTDTVTITVNSLPLVYAGADTALCTGDSITLSGSGAESYFWNNGIVNGVAFIPLSTLTYYVTGTDINGCVNSDSVMITVNSLPAVYAGADTALCSGGSATLSGSGAESYIWSNGITDGVAFFPLSSLQYFVTGTDISGCSSTDSVIITVNLFPVVYAGPDTAMCAGDSLVLYGNGAESYIWDNGINNGQYFIPLVTLDYIVTGTDTNGCINTDTLAVIVNPLPPVYAGADTVMCAEDSVSLSASGAESYIWSNGITNGEYFIPLSTSVYTVTGTDINGCVNTDSVTMTVNPLPPVYAGADTAVCAGTSVILTGSGALYYSWSNGISDGVTFIPVNDTTIYTLTGTDSNNCSETDSVRIVVHPLPLLSVSSDTIICLYDTITLNAAGGTTISWTPDYWLNNPYIYNPLCFSENSTTYTATISDIYSCSQTGSINVTVLNPDIVIVSEPVVIYEGENTQLSVGYTNYGSTILWFPSDYLSCNTCPNPIASPTQTTEYTVMIIDSLGCFEVYGYVLIEVHNEFTLDVPSAFTPNGDGENDVIYVRGWGLKKLLEFSIFNRWGELIYTSDDINQGWDGTFKGMLQNIDTYVYIVKAETLNGTVLKKEGYIQLLR